MASKVYLTPQQIAAKCGVTMSSTHRSAMVKCPSHKDKRASMRITQGLKATVLYCHAGCTLDTICEALGIRSQQLFHDYDPKNQPNPIASLRLAEMIRNARAPTIHELAPHHSLEDVLRATLDMSLERWATVGVRWHRELCEPFEKAMRRTPFVLGAIVGDLLEEYMDAGYDYTLDEQQRMNELLWNEWKKRDD